MAERVFLGWGRHMLPFPAALWRRRVRGRVRQIKAHLEFMGGDHHRVRNLAVLEVARTGRPLPAQDMARRLGLPLERVEAILRQLQARMTFLFRNPAGEVLWAYPFTAEPTPHRLSLDGGQEVFAA